MAVFTSKGYMMLKWKKKKSPETVLRRIALGRHRNENGQGYYFERSALQYNQPILESMLDFPETVLHADKTRLVWQALASITGELNKESFFEACKKKISEYNAKPNQKFCVLTSLSISPEILPSSISFNGCVIKFLRGDYPRKYSCRKDIIEKSVSKPSDGQESYAKVIVYVNAKTADKAINIAIEQLDVIRGVWNLCYNPVDRRRFDSVREPINQVCLGNIHTVHMKNGEPSENPCWVQEDFITVNTLKPTRPDAFKKVTQSWLSALRTCHYMGSVCESIRTAMAALDEKNPTNSFIRLWTALERIVTDDSANHEDLIRRCSFLIDDHIHAREMLNHLRHVRNGVVHDGNYGNSAEKEVFLLLRYYDAVVRYHLARNGRFKTMKEANEFLDLSPDVGELKRQVALLKKAIAIRQEAPV